MVGTRTGRADRPWPTATPALTLVLVRRAVDRLTAEDRLILWPDELWPQDVGVLSVLDGSSLLESDGRFRIEVAREAIEARLYLLPRFRQIIYVPRRGLGGPLWVDAPHFDLRDHVQVAQLPIPGDEAQLLQTTEQLRGRRLDRSRPLWEAWFLPGLPDDRIGMFVRLHHVVADGIAGVAALGALLDVGSDVAPALPQPWTPATRPDARDLLADNLRRQVNQLGRWMSVVGRPMATVRRTKAAWPAMRELFAEKPGPRTSLDRVVGPHRTLALIRGNLQVVEDVAHAHAATVNDVLLTVIAGGLRALLYSRGERIEDVNLPIYVPVSLRRDRAARAAGNLISQMIVHLPLGIADPARRLRETAAETARRKSVTRPSLGTMFHGKVTRLVMLRLVIRQRVNVVTADLPGPQQPLYFAGSQLLEMFPLVNLLGNESLGVGALSYAGQFNLMAVSDTDAYPDLDVFVAGARDEIQTLGGATAASEVGT